MAFALVGLVVFGASSLVGATLVFSGGYTSTIHCDREAARCKVEIPRHSAEVALDQGPRFERTRNPGSRAASAVMLWLVTPSPEPVGKPKARDFVCALPDSEAAAARLDALADDANRFLQGDERAVLDLRCEGRTATLGNSLMMTGLSLLIAVASAITLRRGVRQMRSSQAG